MIKIGSEFLRKINNKEIMLILELICYLLLGYIKYFKLLRELFGSMFYFFKIKVNENYD